MFEQLKFLSGTVGWREVSDAVRAKLTEDRYGSILIDTRELAAELLYYLRDVPVPLYVWPWGPVPMHHYEMTRPLPGSTAEPILYVSLRGCPSQIEGSFRSVEQIGMQRVTLVKEEARVLHFCRLSGYAGPPAPNAPAP